MQRAGISDVTPEVKIFLIFSGRWVMIERGTSRPPEDCSNLWAYKATRNARLSDSHQSGSSDTQQVSTEENRSRKHYETSATRCRSSDKYIGLYRVRSGRRVSLAGRCDEFDPLYGTLSASVIWSLRRRPAIERAAAFSADCRR